MTDHLDRAAQAAFARWSDRLTWADLDETFGQAWRAQTAAALRVMAADLRSLHSPYTVCMDCDGSCDLDDDHATVIVCAHCCTTNGYHDEKCADTHPPSSGLHAHCATTRILDEFTGGES